MHTVHDCSHCVLETTVVLNFDLPCVDSEMQHGTSTNSRLMRRPAAPVALMRRGGQERLELRLTAVRLSVGRAVSSRRGGDQPNF